MGRQDCDQAGRDRHRHDRDLQRAFAADPVAEMAEQETAERTRQIADGEHREGVEESGDRIFGGEELPADRRGEEAEDGKIVPLEHIADGPGNDRTPVDIRHDRSPRNASNSRRRQVTGRRLSRATGHRSTRPPSPLAKAHGTFRRLNHFKPAGARQHTRNMRAQSIMLIRFIAFCGLTFVSTAFLAVPYLTIQ